MPETSTMGDLSDTSGNIPPVKRKNSAPLHPNAVRRFREELRLGREEFAKLIGISAASIRIWETPNASRPDGRNLIRLMELAEQNQYPFEASELYADVDRSKKPSKKKSRRKVDRKKKRA